MKTKKGQVLDNLGLLAVGVVTLAITLVIVFLILGQGKDVAIGQVDATTNTNVTKTITNGTTTIFGDCIDDEAMVVSTITNSSNGAAIILNSGNYTVSLNTIAMDVGGNTESASKNITYACKAPSTAYNATETLQNTTNTIPDWVPLIVIAVVGSILLGLVALFRRR